LILLLFVLQFFRHPKRPIPEPDEDLIYSPADGKVVVVEELPEFKGMEGACIQVSIFMSPFDVHVNRVPISGTVISSDYKTGKYLVAWHPKSSELNEQQEVAIQHANGTLVIKQIAGAVARRVVCYAKRGDLVKQGDELGFIKFGSRADLIMPKDSVEVLVKPGQKVKGNIDTIARWNY
jgi:phosphatidylserine decarboxylase